ncbi:hypothetical protein C7U92_10285 [Bradyrhizobium sp. WBOS7]|uniref:Uncharacterized protein n=1 Tax=Bradyrhizobium betae TaxID=244734 RepID=A0AAE9N8A2_9BRAD|nr:MULTISPECIES: hypothetical protein [Bradyrhizobium]MDD1573070.1 hypothetical protein [Bradyrhizobium sp. WBOS1]UUO33994.1 hypothetical protein DCK84_05005 [Bradyrhizobium sp. WBOS01]MDD1528561.1 hypothetical protein [Bradyrhizobium sp. WBOS2]MDD1577117.1 hypothetical protein [Bradyrhizobium sp. WBOS7]MDD1600164.1 hypothetical protein [Bradyrhizobium sp. WBOS16]
MSDDLDSNPKLPILHAHAAAVLRVGKDAADAVLVKFGGRGGPGGYRAVPAPKQMACIEALERLAAGPANSNEAIERNLKRLSPAAMANFGNGKPKAPRAPKSFDDLSKSAWDRFNNPPPQGGAE